MKTTSITARLNYRADSEGCHALIIQVIHRRRRSILTTPYRLRPEEFDAQRGRAVAVNRTKSRRTLIREANECVALCTEELRAVCARLAASGKPYTASDITGAYRSGNDNRYVEAFAKQLASDLEEAGRFGTARSYRSLCECMEQIRGTVPLSFFSTRRTHGLCLRRIPRTARQPSQYRFVLSAHPARPL